MTCDDSFDDGDCVEQDLIDVLDQAERAYRIPFLQAEDAEEEKPLSPVSNQRSDFAVPSLSTPLTGAVGQRTAVDDIVTLTREELETIKRDAFIAGLKFAQKSQLIFPFLNLPAELRLVFYRHYFLDRNPQTFENCAAALPNRLNDPVHCCSPESTWCKTVRPWISTSLMLACKQIYYETRDEYLYKNRVFKASIGRFDDRFKEMRPHLRFWQYIQHFELELTPEINQSARHETGALIVDLIALLRGGKNLKSFKLTYMANERIQSISRFEDLSIQGNVSLTQSFRDWLKPGPKEELERKDRLEKLLFGILGCASYNAPPYDCIISLREVETDVTYLHPDTPRYETFITLSTSID
ncbi:hypothetical protein, variant [Verruconis gallopava]|uniref:Uncharacterized protein n=1 Tax=Verruconis gallopava TaxID=253628 RepID=A0A0D2A1N2_9PEZI|nr:uncharacterized protein PV09_07818 [Verruconis gallopava]XP_016210492.1 hypothetical protein, variant [Verruconis gallopava]KIW00622.1 hypothetical protein PV09_07818 [Verruconis gallopava]KIW00623.1 hypothetical protein, variant [Verruconis gallopava]